MAHVYKEAHRVVTVDRNDPDYFDDSTVLTDSPVSVLARIVYFVGGAIIMLLALRFLLSLFGANTGNTIVNFVYSVTRPLVAPFFGLFNTSTLPVLGRFEYETLFALFGYGLLASTVVWLLSLLDHRHMY